MDFTHYNPSEDPYSGYDESSNEMDLDNLAFQLGEIKKLVDIDTVIDTDPKSTEMEEAMDSLTETFQKVTIAPSQKYNKYGQDQIERFIRLI